MSKSIKIVLSISLAFLIYSCSEDDSVNPGPGGNSGGNEITGEIWTGSNITFTKADGADPTEEANQDRITDNVWITRGNNGGQIYNIKSEGSANKDQSPGGTEWAQGTIDNVANLNFKPFREAVGSPKSVEGKNLVVHLIDDDIYISVKFSNWSEGKAGGFRYERSTK